MWLSQRKENRILPDGGADVGQITLAGDPAGVWLDGERRELPVFGPGGYVWRPQRNSQALVIKTGRQGEAPCVAGVRCMEEQWDLEEGEVLIYSPKATIHLQEDGTVNITGRLTVNGKSVLTSG